MQAVTLTPTQIRDRIIEKYHYRKNKPFIILGEPGPTGKTWLWNELKARGFNAIEISESILPFVEYKDDGNYILENTLGCAVVIVLNKRLR